MIKDAFEQLLIGNENFLKLTQSFGDFSPEKRDFTYKNGQKPYAIILSCCDSRVIPEVIFSAGIGDLFVIRSLGNFVGDNELEAIEYAIDYFGIKHILVLGHTCCGAVNAAINEEFQGYKSTIVNKIKTAIKEEKDYNKCENLYLDHLIEIINRNLNEDGNLQIIKAIYDIKTGKVNF